MLHAKPMAMLAPAGLVLAALFIAPMSYLFLQSFWQIKFYMLDTHFTLANYGVLIQQYGACWMFTLEIAGLIAVLTTLGAFLLAYYARFKAGRYEGLILFLTMMTLFGGYLVKVYAWKTILGTDGIINSALLWLHIVRRPLGWLLYTPFAVVVTLVNFLLPFAVLPIYASIRTVDPRTLESARDLGATPLQVWRDVLIPQTGIGIVTGFSLAFLLAAGDYVTPQLVGGTQSVMIGNFIESQFVDLLNAPLGAAMSFSVLGSCLLILVAAGFGMRRIGRQK